MGTQLVLTEANLPHYLRKLGLFEGFETIRVEKAGDGNINWVRRASAGAGADRHSLVIKQARPALERFPEYEAPTERLVFEARYFEIARAFDEDGVCPAIHGFDPEDRVLVLEDLGDVPRLDEQLALAAVAAPVVTALAGFLGRVHAGTRNPALAARFANGPMQRLHGDHIFELPLHENDFPLPPLTRDRAESLWRDAALGDTAARAYERFLTPKGALVHGDVQAGNVLLLPTGPKLLDAEIAHLGDPAFDVGTLIAHLALAAVARDAAAEGAPSIDAAWAAYASAHGSDGLTDFAGVARYAGLEMLRRTVGAARVPCVESDDAGLRVIETSLRWILDPPEQPRRLLRS